MANPIHKQILSEQIKEKAHELGFDFCGISRAQALDEEARKLELWLNQGKHGEMQWMENYFDKRIDPRKLVEGAKSVVSLLYNYAPPKEEILHQQDGYKISKYAYGKDYHRVLKKKLKKLVFWLKDIVGDFQGRAFVDSAPVMDKIWAVRGGIAWQGKNSLAINPKQGSFFFIAELISDLELEYDNNPMRDYCGSCTRCLEACPTNAITEPYVVDASRCISYFTIELKDEIPTNVKGKFENWIFGCDICQDVCPWNRRSKPHQEPAFLPKEALQKMNKTDWQEITEEVFNQLFEGSPLRRTKFEGLKRNIKFVSEIKHSDKI
ncbi:MAG: tRNA epoxyqueuosine(34) reductase QueG [Bernardetiaceae bacterium]|nr:tRNA epoxyqueuosine(34) reductase QueG [Bernardetiaceae bacterium]